MRSARWRRIIAALGLAMVGLCATNAFAQNAPIHDAQIGKIHFQSARAYFEAGRFEQAIAEFQESFSHAPHPATLFNIARCYQKLNRPDEALHWLDRYRETLGSKRTASDDADIAIMRRDLEAMLPAAAAAPAPVPAPTVSAPSHAPTLAQSAPAIVQPQPPARPPLRRGFIAGISLEVLGAAALISALGTGLAEHAQYGNLVAACPAMMCPAAERGALESTQRLAVTTDVLLGVGIASVAVGTVLAIV